MKLIDNKCKSLEVGDIVLGSETYSRTNEISICEIVKFDTDYYYEDKCKVKILGYIEQEDYWDKFIGYQYYVNSEEMTKLTPNRKGIYFANDIAFTLKDNKVNKIGKRKSKNILEEL